MRRTRSTAGKNILFLILLAVLFGRMAISVAGIIIHAVAYAVSGVFSGLVSAGYSIRYSLSLAPALRILGGLAIGVIAGILLFNRRRGRAQAENARAEEREETAAPAREEAPQSEEYIPQGYRASGS